MAVVCLGWSGCAHRPQPPTARSFVFGTDTFAFANQTYWTYQEDPATGKMSHEPRVPPPDFAHRCFVVVRAAKEFWLHATFQPDLPRLSPAEYRSRVRTVVARSSRRASPGQSRIVFPGYSHLHQFSTDYCALLQEELGGAWQSYTQRGHWRMLFPFSESHQNRVAENLLATLPSTGVAVVHVVRFPALSINHAVLVYAAHPEPHAIRFDAYDPNDADQPVSLIFDRATGRFTLPRTPYFIGGRVDAYEVYRSAWY